MEKLKKEGLGYESFVISITDPTDDPLFPGDTDRRTCHQFYDIEPRTDGEMDELVLIYPAMLPVDAVRMVKLIRRAHASPHDEVLYVNCEAGISRSGAVADFVQNVCRLPWEDFKRDNAHIFPNAHVKRLLREAWECIGCSWDATRGMRVTRPPQHTCGTYASERG